MSWFSLAIGQNASRQLATSSENLVASPQFLVALATSESQCRALKMVPVISKHLIWTIVGKIGDCKRSIKPFPYFSL